MMGDKTSPCLKMSENWRRGVGSGNGRAVLLEISYRSKIVKPFHQALNDASILWATHVSKSATACRFDVSGVNNVVKRRPNQINRWLT